LQLGDILYLGFVVAEAQIVKGSVFINLRDL